MGAKKMFRNKKTMTALSLGTPKGLANLLTIICLFVGLSLFGFAGVAGAASYKYHITLAGDGSVTGTGDVACPTTCDSTDIDEGATVNLYVSPDPGWKFVNWTGNVGGFDSTTSTTPTFIMGASARNITANFCELGTFYFSAATGGSLSGTATKQGCTGEFSSVGPTAIPDGNHSFAKWTTTCANPAWGPADGFANPYPPSPFTGGQTCTMVASFTPNYVLSIADAADVAEGTASTFRISVTPAIEAGDTVTVDYSTVAGTAGTSDYTAVSNITVTFNTGGQTFQDITVATTDDALVEVTESYTVQLSNATTTRGTATINTGADSGTGEITDNDTATFTINDQTVNEDAGTMMFTISLDNALDIAVTVDVSYADVTATGGGTDYDSAADTVNFAAGDTTDKTVTVSITNDSINETTETFTASLSTATDLGGRNTNFTDTGTGTINDNDHTVTFSVATIPVTETGGSITGDNPQTLSDGEDCSPVTAVANPGYRFVEWSGSISSTDNPLTVTNVTSDMSIAANFIAIYTLTPTAGANGSISPDVVQTVDYGTDKTFYMTPNAGYCIQSVVVDGYSQAPVLGAYTFSGVKENHTISAAFGIQATETCYRVDQREVLSDWHFLGTFEFAAGSNGSVTLTRESGHGDYTCADAVRFRKTSGGTEVIIDDYNPDNPNGDEYTTTGTWTLSSVLGGYGHDYGSGRKSFYTNSNGTTATWTPDLPVAGEYEVYAWWAGNSSRDYSAPYCINGYSSGHVITAGAGANGTISPSGTTTLNTGDDITYTITPDPGYVVDVLDVDGVTIGDASGATPTYIYTFYNVGRNHTINASFVPDDASATCYDMDQGVNGGQWHLIGTFYFAEGTGAYVTVTRENDASNGSNTLADAVWFEKTDGTSGVTVDNENSNNPDGSYSETGNWTNSGSPNPWGPASDSSPTARYTQTVGDYATWTPDLPSAGAYRVYAWWNSYSARDHSAPYCIINHTGKMIRATAGPNGSITPEGDVYVPTGSDITFTITPNSGYITDYVLVDGFDIGAGVTEYTFYNVTTDHTIEVNFGIGEPSMTCIDVNQNENYSQWYLLGTFTFPGGTGAYVTMTREADQSSTCADAVRFVRVSDGTEIIVDNTNKSLAEQDPNDPYFESGSWSNSSGANPYVTQSRYSSDSSTPGVATWRPTLPGAGEYRVYAWWTKSGTRAYHAPYCIHNHTGEAIVATAGTHGVLVSSGVTVESETTQVFTVASGSNITFDIVPDDGYAVDDVLIDGSSVTPIPTTYTFINVLSSRTIEATFEDHGDDCDNATPITCGDSLAGKISPADDWDYFKLETGGGIFTIEATGDDYTYGYILDTSCATASPIAEDDDSGVLHKFKFVDVELPAGTYYIAVRQDPDRSYSERNYSLNITCQHVIRATARTGGHIDPAGDNIVNHGANITFTITPDVGNTLEDVLVDSVSVGGVTEYTFNNVTANHTILAQFSLPPSSCNDISDVTMNTMMVGVPTNIMFVLDDSGSMDWELITEEADGLFEHKYYIFNNPGDNKYANSYILPEADRGKWKSQWSGYNKMYYNPKNKYEPWPTLSDADLDTPLSHPYHGTGTLNLSATYYTVQQAYNVDNEGYFDSSEVFHDDPAGTNFVTTETWRRSGGSPWYGPDPPRSIYTNVLGAKATWTTTLPTGDYEVYAWWTSYTSRATNAPYTIHYYDGGPLTHEVRKDQRYNGGKWVKLGGTYHFDAGTPASVSIVRENDNDNTCADAVCFIPVGSAIDIPYAHYYTWYDSNGNGRLYDDSGELESGETVYLITLDSGTSTIQYYQVNLDDDIVRSGDLYPVLDPENDVPATVRPTNAGGSDRTYEQERQNFANWYSFYRRRMHTAIAAMSQVIYQMAGVNIGIRGINGDIVQEVLPIKVGTDDDTSTLLTTLYSYVQQARGTPLRRGLEKVGQYYNQEDDPINGGIGDSPYEANGEGGECQQCFAIVMTDGYWNGSTPDADNEDGDGNTAFDGPPYGDDYDHTLADVAMYYYENDLASLLDNKVPKNPEDNAEHQHMVTYGVSFGVTGTLNPADYDLSSGVTVPWPQIVPDNRTTLDDLWHASVNGRGMFLSASNPQELISSLLAIMENIAARTGSASSVSINGDELYDTVGANIRMFQASYSSGTMTGDVKSYAIDEITGGVTETPLWSAVDILENDLDTYGHTSRIVATYSDVSHAGIPFRYTNISTSGSTEQQNYLLPDWGDPVVATPENLINYLRGDETHEEKNGGPFRNRLKPLADIVHSSPVHTNGVLYVGGNDGMLHAINAENGRELFSYVPNLVYENLKEFGNPDYQHKFFVDLTPTVKSGVIISGVQKTLLVGGLGKGGKGYYCLDISGVSNDPCVISSENILASRVMWEYPNSGTTTSERDDMGYTYSKAFVVKSNDPTNARWIVVFGNGYNSENSKAVLLILNPSDGSLLKRIDTQVGSCNGLSTPLLVDYDSDEKVDFIYAGDLKGNLWKFDLTSNNFSDWDVAYKSGASPQPLFQAKGPGGETQHITTKPDAMFHCEKGGIMVVFGTGMYLGGDDLLDTSTQTIYGIWDYQYEDNDNTEYLGSFDRGSTPLLSNQPLYDISMLEQTSIWEGYVDVGGVTSYVRVLSANEPDWQTTTKDPDDFSCGENTGSIPCDPNSTGNDPDPVNDVGWYFDFPTTGERVVSDLLIRLGNVVLIAFTPADSPCSAGGDSMVMEMDACTGGRLPYAQFDLNDDGVIDEDDLIKIPDPDNPGQYIWVAPTGRRYEGRLQPPVILRLIRTDSEKKYFSSSGGVIEELTEKAARIGMIYWREHD
jgi:Tfp pilus tip-associated adhesin PilY1